MALPYLTFCWWPYQRKCHFSLAIWASLARHTEMPWQWRTANSLSRQAFMAAPWTGAMMTTVTLQPRQCASTTFGSLCISSTLYSRFAPKTEFTVCKNTIVLSFQSFFAWGITAKTLFCVHKFHNILHLSDVSNVTASLWMTSSYPTAQKGPLCTFFHIKN